MDNEFQRKYFTRARENETATTSHPHRARRLLTSSCVSVRASITQRRRGAGTLARALQAWCRIRRKTSFAMARLLPPTARRTNVCVKLCAWSPSVWGEEMDKSFESELKKNAHPSTSGTMVSLRNSRDEAEYPKYTSWRNAIKSSRFTVSYKQGINRKFLIRNRFHVTLRQSFYLNKT